MALGHMIEALQAAVTYFHCLKSTFKKKEKGVLQDCRKKLKRQQRKANKRNRRRTALRVLEGKMPTDEVSKLQRLLQSNEYISSEEDFSEEGEDENEAAKHFLLRPLPWGSEFVDRHFKRLDGHSRRMSKRHGGPAFLVRTYGLPSERMPPSDAPDYALRA
ncbi:uncharacterized protein LOC124275525 [Haliotis rubra]|uniref:uncharacterized protein LOC124275525 n=1 Tax=Haliotis rubra TaxID=36100 RepID=UPI001EE4FD06|nr:uncharacterized protein LOC124275525 [Haliotis rubra]